MDNDTSNREGLIERELEQEKSSKHSLAVNKLQELKEDYKVFGQSICNSLVKKFRDMNTIEDAFFDIQKVPDGKIPSLDFETPKDIYIFNGDEDTPKKLVDQSKVATLVGEYKFVFSIKDYTEKEIEQEYIKFKENIIKNILNELPVVDKVPESIACHKLVAMSFDGKEIYLVNKGIKLQSKNGVFFLSQYEDEDICKGMPLEDGAIYYEFSSYVISPQDICIIDNKKR